jgi:hypothetical protein
LRDSFDSTNAGRKYEPPRAVRLGDAETGVGSVCKNGGTPGAHCEMVGSFAQGSCQDGTWASPDCKVGTSAVPQCNAGTGVI